MSANVHNKVVAGGLGGAVSIVFVWIVTLFGVEVPATVASAFTTIFAFLCSYIKRG